MLLNKFKPSKFKLSNKFKRTIAMNFESSEFTFAAIQMKIGSDKTLNIKNARDRIITATQKGAQVVSLPECFTGPYGTQYFAEYSESATDGPAFQMLSEVAQQTGCYLIGGSFPEKDQEQIFNTCLIFDPNGNQIGRHRKLHLFDIDIPGKIKFIESDILTRGSSITVVETKFGNIGIGICYDLRFNELAQLYQKLGCKMICYPGAFNMTTGPVHWELLIRSRALDNQVYVAGICSARNTDATYHAWGHSTVANPWGEVIATTEHDEDIVYAKIDLKKIDEVRSQIPILKQKRYDVYTGVEKI
jgi:omega-amidase